MAVSAQEEQCCPAEFNQCLSDGLCQETIVHCIEKMNAELSDETNQQEVKENHIVV